MSEGSARQQDGPAMRLTGTWPLLIGVQFLTLAAIGLLVAREDDWGALHDLCTTVMYGRGWYSFMLWLPAALVATPVRALGSGALRTSIHAALATLAWAWLAIALTFADLFARADLLWAAYSASGAAIALWRLVFHRWLLRTSMRRALVQSPACIGLVQFALGDFSRAVETCRVSPSAWLLGWLGRVRAWTTFARFHRFMYGRVGVSSLAIAEAMNACDRRVGSLRRMLGDRSSADALRAASQSAASSFDCEVRLAIGIPAAEEHHPDIDLTLRRAMIVLEALLLAQIECGDGVGLPVFEGSIQLLTQGCQRLEASRFSQRLARALSIRSLPELQQAIGDPITEPQATHEERFLCSMAVACAAIRLRAFRVANSILGQAERQAAHLVPPDAPSDGSLLVTRVAHALASESESRSSNVEVPADAATTHRSVVERRSAASLHHGQMGLHPRLARARAAAIAVTPSQVGMHARPRRPREVGVGLLAAGLVVILGTVTVSYLAPRPLTNRIQHLRNVPFGGAVGSSSITTAAVVAPTGTLILGDPSEGARTIDFATMRLRREQGPPPNGPGGPVTHLAASSAGTTIAIVNPSPTMGPGVSMRTLDGSWKTLLRPAGSAIDGSDFEALISGLDRPVILLKSGIDRLLEYDHDERVLVPCKVVGDTSIEGRFVDVSSALSGVRSLVTLLTENDGPRIYTLAREEGDAVRVRKLTSPPLDQGSRALAIVASTEGMTVLVDSLGGAWLADANDLDGRWSRIRAGSQDLALDRIDLAALSDAGRHLWFIRNGVVWTRELPAMPTSPSHGIAWRKVTLPPSAGDFQPGRTMLVDLGGQSTLLATPATSVESSRGSAVLLTTSDKGALDAREILPERWRLLDGDHTSNAAMILVERPNPPGEGAVARALLTLTPGTKRLEDATVVGVFPIRDERGTPPSLDGDIVAAGTNGQRGILIYDNGRFLQFDGAADRLLPSAAGKGDLWGVIQGTSSIIDGTIVGEGGSIIATMLRANHSIDRATIGLDSNPSTTTLVRTDDGPPNAFLGHVGLTLTDEDGFLALGDGAAWQFTLGKADGPWTERSAVFEQGAPRLTGCIDSVGVPLAAWIPDTGGGIRTIDAAGSTNTWGSGAMQVLGPAIGAALFASDEQGSLWSFDTKRPPSMHLAATSHGPASVVQATLRPDHIDFLAPGRLHSFDRRTGAWSQSVELGGNFALRVVGDPATPSLLLLPGSSDIPFALAPDEPASRLRRLGDKPLKQSIALRDGVLGVLGTNGLAWVELDGSSEVIPDTLKPKASIQRIDEAIAKDGAIYIHGVPQDGSTRGVLGRYDLSRRHAIVVDSQPVKAMEIGSNGLFAHAGGEVTKYDLESLEQRASWPVEKGDDATLGRVDGAHAAVARGGGIQVLADSGAIDVLVPPSDSTDIGTPGLAVAEADHISIFARGKAWQRGASGTQPFKRVDKVDFTPDRAVFGEHPGESWFATAADWHRLPDGMVAGKNLGFLPGIGAFWETGTLRRLRTESAHLPYFAPAPSSLGTPREFEPLSKDKALILGSMGAAVFDCSLRSFAPAPDVLSHVDARARLFTRGDSVLIHAADGLAFAIAGGNAISQFGGKPVRQVAWSDDFVVGLTEAGVILDADGKVLASQFAGGQPGSVISLKAAVTDGSKIYGLTPSRSISQFDPATLTHRLFPGSADALASAGSVIVAHNASEGTAHVLDTQTSWHANSAWFAGHSAVVTADPLEGIQYFNGTKLSTVCPSAEPLPGVVIGSVPGTTYLICEVTPGVVAFFDAITGHSSGNRVGGDLLVPGSEGVYAIGHNATVVELHAPEHSETLSSTAFAHVAIRTDGSTAFIAALDATNLRNRVVRLDPKTLKVAEVLLDATTETPPLASQDDAHETKVVRLWQGAQLVIGPSGIVLDAGKSSLSFIENPLGTAAIRVTFEAGRIVARDDKQRAFTMLRWNGRDFLPESTPKIDASDDPTSQAVRRLASQLLPEVWFDIPAGQVGQYVVTSRGTLDTQTGWLLDRAIKDIRIVASRLEFQDFTGAWREVTTKVPAKSWQKGMLAVPFTVGQAQLLQVVHGGVNIALGVPNTGHRLECHDVRAIGIADHAQVVWIDALGQLWTLAGSSRRITPVPERLESFCVDEQGRLHASSHATRYEVNADPNGLVRLVPAARAAIFKDCSELAARAGAISWSAIDGALQFRLNVPGINAIAIRPTSNGFDCFAIRELQMLRADVVAVLAIGSNQVVAPVRRYGVAWSELTPGRDCTSTASPRPPRQTLQLSDGTELVRRAGTDAAMRVGSSDFQYLPDQQRFSCDACAAATNLGADLVTASHDGRALIHWALAGSDLHVVGAKLLALPPSPEVIRLGPSERAGAMVAETRNGLFEFTGSDWAKFTASKFIKARRAAWSWMPGTKMFRLGDTDYMMLEANGPRFACDRVELNTASPRDSLHAMADGSVAYRGTDGAWFRVAAGTMPKPVEEPEPAAAATSTSWLEVDRVRAPSNPTVSCKLLDGAEGMQLEFKIVEGVFPDTDTFRVQNCLSATGNSSAKVLCANAGIERPIEIRGARATLSPPRRLTSKDVARRFEPVLSDGKLLIDGTVVRRPARPTSPAFDLGRPGPEGFAPLAPNLIVPFAVGDKGELTFAHRGTVFQLAPGERPEDIAVLGSAPRHSARTWRVNGDRIEFLLLGDGAEWVFDASTSHFRQCMPTAVPPSLDLFQQAKSASLHVSTEGESSNRLLRIRRANSQRPVLDMTLAAGTGDRARFLHFTATRLLATAEGLTALGSDFQAVYRRGSSGTLALESVRALDAQSRPVDVIPIPGGLFAHRTPPAWKLRTGPDATSPDWPLIAFLGPERTYLGADGVFEIASQWSRFRHTRGVVRWAGSSGASISGQGAYRSGDRIVGADTKWSLSATIGVARSTAPTPPEPRGQFSAVAAPGWEVRLPEAGAACTIIHDGIVQAVINGSLPIDYAIAAYQTTAGIRLIDRGGFESIAPSKAPAWSPLTEQLRSDLSKRGPTRTLERAATASPSRVLPASGDAAREELLLPFAAAGALTLQAPDSALPLHSSTAGPTLEAKLAVDGTVQFTRILALPERRFNYPPMLLDRSCARGRFAFDHPVDAFLSSIPGTSPPIEGVCMQTQLGWEWLGNGAEPIAIALDAPLRLPTPYDSVPRPAWLVGTDFAPDDSKAQLAELFTKTDRACGGSLLWYPWDGRLFVVGKDSVVWIELSPRWSGRPLKN